MSEPLRDVVNAMPVIDSILTVSVIAIGFILTRRWPRMFSLAISRWRAFRARGSRITLRQHFSRVRQILESGQLLADDEMQWLSDIVGDPACPDRALAFQASSRQLKDLADAYGHHAARLAGRAFFGAATTPALAHLLSLTEATRDYLLNVSMHRALRPESPGHWANKDGTSSPPRRFAPMTILHRGVTITPLALPTRRPRADAFDLLFSCRRHLTAPQLPDAPWQRFLTNARISPLTASSAELDRLESRLANSGEFDNLLPRMVDFRVERDLSSGHRRLHIAAAATSYSSVILDHYCGELQNRQDTPPGGMTSRWHGPCTHDVNGGRVGALTLSLIPVTRCGHLLFAERSELTGSHAGLIGPAVNGNLELLARPVVSVDADGFGTPDPLAALVREAREELGLKIRRDTISTVGLIRFDSPSEKGTNVLLATAPLEQDVEEVAQGIHYADPIEGRWEVGKSLLAVKLPRSEEEAVQLASWLWNARELTPHATAAGLAVLMAARDCPNWDEIPIDPDVARPSQLVRNIDMRHAEAHSSRTTG